MNKSRKPEPKPLSFSTTMRNPHRIVSFLNALVPFENRVLTHDIIMKIVNNVIRDKLYKPMYITRNPLLKTIYEDESMIFTEEQLSEIIENSPQNHKEAGFDSGWDSRFDTWYKLSMEFGFVSYAINEPIKISNVGHMLIDAYNEESINEEKIQNVFLNSLMKYQTNNPYRKNANENTPLILLLEVLKLLKEDTEENGAGVFRKELSLFICWKDKDSYSLYQKIKEIRRLKKFNYSDEYMYDICLDLLNANSDKKQRFKIEQITGEAVDEYIRKMRSTGIISLRGGGKFIDFNMIEEEKINYILSNYVNQPTFLNKQDYFNYIGTIDFNILNLEKSKIMDIDEIRKKALFKYSEIYSPEEIFSELKKVCNKKESTDLLLRTIPGPARLEFLTSIALVQQFKGLQVNPNYIIDDEGLPTTTALGSLADIVCYEEDCGTLVEVTLMTSKKQVNDEIIPIKRHLLEFKTKNKVHNSFSIFVAPRVHPDAKDMADWFKHRDNVDILTYNIDEFIGAISENSRISDLLY